MVWLAYPGATFLEIESFNPFTVLRGLAQVNFGPKDPAQCLARIIPASKDIDNDAHVDWTQCVAHDKF